MNKAWWERFLSYFFQTLLLIMFVVGIFDGDLYTAGSALFGFGFVSIPWFLKREKIMIMPFELTLWIFVAIFLHNFGVMMKFYDDIWWWDKLTHFLSTSLIAVFGFVVIVIVDKYVDSIHLPPRFLPFFIIVFVSAMGVIWEIIEFILDTSLGTHMQYSLTDTATDLVSDTLGGLAIAAIGPLYLSHRSIDALAQEMKVEKTVKRITRRNKDG
ncbi:MAG: hypothetical protein LUQ55_05490 [Methanomassiliicoccales archaeon]|nr:hypothetical protein [Methanomassiliicoccales archaeon]